MSPKVAHFTTPKIRRLAERVMEGDRPLGRAARVQLERALNDSERDREAYDALAGLFGALESGPSGAPALSQGQRAQILAAVQHQVQARLPQPKRGWIWRLAPALAMLLVGFVVALALRPPGTSTAISAFQHRGSVAVGQEGKLGIKALCVRDGKVLAPPPLHTDAESIAASCELGDELQLTLTHTARFSHLLVIGDLVDAESGQHTLTWYHPAPPTGRSGGVATDVVDEVLGQARRLSVNHKPGLLRVVAIFSRTPVAARASHAKLRTLGRTDRAGPALERVDDQGRVEVTAVDLHVKIEGGAR